MAHACPTRAVLSASALVVAMLPCTPARAAPVVYTSLAAWTAAVGGIQTENFDASPAGPLAVGTTDIGLFNLFITTADPNSAIASGGFVNGSRELRIFLVNDVDSIARFDFDAPIRAWAADFFSTTTGDLLTVIVNGTTIEFDQSLAFPGTGFFGVIDTSPFSSITFDRENILHPDGEFFAVDDFHIAATAAIPDPGSLALLGLGLAGLGFGRRKPGRTSATQGIRKIIL